MDAVKDLNKQDQQQEEKKPFIIQDDKGLAWAAEKMEEHRKQLRVWQDMEQQATEFYAKKAKDEMDSIDNLKGMVRQYATEQLNSDPKWKYDKSPFMRVVRQTHDAKLVADDKEALTKQFAGTKYAPAKPKLDWSALKDYLKYDDSGIVFTKDGELVDGAKVVKKPDTIEIKHIGKKGKWTADEKK